MKEEETKKETEQTQEEKNREKYVHCDHGVGCEWRCSHECCEEREKFIEEVEEDMQRGVNTLYAKYNIWVQRLVTKDIKETCSFCLNYIRDNQNAMQKRY
jgi:hypothetical protein